ncbi:MAG: hypothetical protein H0W39_07305 [Sphingomonas sp.]|nr:hypothetical protein [Sphingomonas sp.]
MIKFAATLLFAILAACSAEVENRSAAEANVVETLSVDNLVIAGPETETAVTGTGTHASPSAPQPQAAAPVAGSSAARTTPPEPNRQTVRKPSTETAAKPASRPRAAPAAGSEAEPAAPTATCTAEHRALGHC